MSWLKFALVSSSRFAESGQRPIKFSILSSQRPTRYLQKGCNSATMLSLRLWFPAPGFQGQTASNMTENWNTSHYYNQDNCMLGDQLNLPIQECLLGDCSTTFKTTNPFRKLSGMPGTWLYQLFWFQWRPDLTHLWLPRMDLSWRARRNVNCYSQFTMGIPFLCLRNKYIWEPISRLCSWCSLSQRNLTRTLLLCHTHCR